MLLIFTSQILSCARIKTTFALPRLHHSWFLVYKIPQGGDRRLVAATARREHLGKGIFEATNVCHAHSPSLRSSAGAGSCLGLGQSFAKPDLGAAWPESASVSPYNTELIATLRKALLRCKVGTRRLWERGRNGCGGSGTGSRQHHPKNRCS